MLQSPNPLNSAWLRMQGAAVVFILTSLLHQRAGGACAYARTNSPYTHEYNHTQTALHKWEYIHRYNHPNICSQL